MCAFLQCHALQPDELILEEWALLKAPEGRSEAHLCGLSLVAYQGHLEPSAQSLLSCRWSFELRPSCSQRALNTLSSLLSDCRHQMLPMLAEALMITKPRLAPVIMELEVGL
jgi:hypothetical protein